MSEGDNQDNRNEDELPSTGTYRDANRNRHIRIRICPFCYKKIPVNRLDYHIFKTHFTGRKQLSEKDGQKLPNVSVQNYYWVKCRFCGEVYKRSRQKKHFLKHMGEGESKLGIVGRKKGIKSPHKHRRNNITDRRSRSNL
ncbi:hypothetical protein [Candidatus Nitrosocosmicus hydrocola]|uniref:hypothetical protein n=1 Tax=Candidatus Nitrosocosmicus hydrocola TaxID=1826872 RepID=UPI0011E5B1FC|nr:hypothetical protein [Candidatus Nitrosocosmicus hydrocola]